MRGAGWSRVTHPFATLFPTEVGLTVRLACVRHAASVHPEPGSNSPFEGPWGPADRIDPFDLKKLKESAPSRGTGYLLWMRRPRRRHLALNPSLDSQYPSLKVPGRPPDASALAAQDGIMPGPAARVNMLFEKVLPVPICRLAHHAPPALRQLNGRNHKAFARQGHRDRQDALRCLAIVR